MVKNKPYGGKRVNIYDVMLRTIAKPTIICDINGNILNLNCHANYMLDTLNKKDCSNIGDLGIDISQIDLSNGYEMTKVSFEYLAVDVTVWKMDKTVLFVFNNILFNKEVAGILNAIDYTISITNGKGAIEFNNNALYSILGLTHDDTEVGNNVIDHFINKTTMTTEPAVLKAMREGHTVTSRTIYATGKALLMKAGLVHGDTGEIKRIVTIGQDVSENSAIDEMLILTGNKESSINTTINFNDANTFFSNEQYIVKSDEMRKVVNKAIKAASSVSSVFIWGESGVGKEMIAKIIHYASQRKDKPFITINCAAIPSELMESELFGYEKGAFTGAVTSGKKGLLEEANGGTVFLDELGEMPYPMQSKLLRAIQENKIRRIGGSKDIPIDIRYVSATNLTVEQFLDNNVLRGDLYYRLSVVPLNVPPLRERKQDLIPLINHFMQYYNEQQNSTAVLSKKAMIQLLNYDWPGNIRELKNVIERSVLLAESDLIEDIDIVNISPEKDGNDMVIYSAPGMIPDNITMQEAYDDLFNIMVNKVYKETGSIVKTAKILDINPSTIHRKIKSGQLILYKEE